MTSTAPRQRRTQEERSTATRERLLDATIDCLIEFGYAGTTVARIADRAGVTRGAQVHHYPTKADLVLAALRHLVAKQVQASVDELPRLQRTNDIVGATLEMLWRIHRGPLFAAIVELWVAARTDPELAAHVGELEPIVTMAVPDLLQGRVAEYLADPVVRNGLYLAMDVMRGLVVSTWHLEPAQVEARWRRAKKQLRPMFPDLDL
ncbi:MAG: TetR/AcrR family transcriptional regulator [Jatrophihabitans sp.]|uniref:TetR/AcrR family transcriptional regulator n=1 Tax=Jatrophihabitans sp. TaxID=1932789 RepID=UPI003F7E54C2